uniref:2-dehydro-3-deoxygalactonokinase n=1 Tax=Ndongobacter massiliensis TaxID=1871025 RepID=UPI00093087D7|nr:2-dehydro-3-deoxygalactonokinase [Ndongobacter massiliensis]
MFAVIDCGTTMTRIYIIRDKKIIASDRKKIGVRDTSITGSRDALRNGVAELFFRTLKNNNIPDESIEFVIASGMITSEIGLIEIPHLVAPVGIHQLSAGIVKVMDSKVLPIGRPIYFIPGIRNDYPIPAKAQNLRQVDFMRGEEVQCIGIMNTHKLPYPCNLVALSSHTKIMHINEFGQISASITTISGQFFEALLNSTSIGKSLIETQNEVAGEYSYNALVSVATDCVRNAGLGRTCMMPRFLQVLMQSNSKERRTFIDAAIAADDLSAFHEMHEQGHHASYYLLYGHKSRCEMYTYMLKKEFGNTLTVENIYDKNELDQLTVTGSIAIALEKIEQETKY